MKFGINVWVTDKNLQALALSTSGATLNPAKRTKYRRGQDKHRGGGGNG